MFEGDMLLPNLEFNPEFEGKDKLNLLNLEDENAAAKKALLSLEEGDVNGQIDNFMHSRRGGWFSQLIRRNPIDDEYLLSEDFIDYEDEPYGDWEENTLNPYHQDSYSEYRHARGPSYDPYATMHYLQ